MRTRAGGTFQPLQKLGLPRILGTPVADLEEHALRKDRRFVVRLVLILLLTAFVGLWAVSHLTTESFGGCVARTMGEAGPPDAGE